MDVNHIIAEFIELRRLVANLPTAWHNVDNKRSQIVLSHHSPGGLATVGSVA